MFNRTLSIYIHFSHLKNITTYWKVKKNSISSRQEFYFWNYIFVFESSKGIFAKILKNNLFWKKDQFVKHLKWKFDFKDINLIWTLRVCPFMKSNVPFYFMFKAFILSKYKWNKQILKVLGKTYNVEKKVCELLLLYLSGLNLMEGKLTIEQ